MDSLDIVFSKESGYYSKEDASFIFGAIIGGATLAMIIGSIVAAGIDHNKAKKLYEENKDEILKEINRAYTMYKEITKHFKEDFIHEFNKEISNPDILRCLDFDVETSITNFIKENKYDTSRAKRNEGYCETSIKLFDGNFEKFLKKYYYVDEKGYLSERGQEVVEDIYDKFNTIVKTISDKYKKEHNINSISMSMLDGDESWEDFDCYLKFTMDWTFLLKK